MSGVTPEMAEVKIDCAPLTPLSLGTAPRHRPVPRSLLLIDEDEDDGGLTADIDRLLVLDALVKPLEADMKGLIDKIKARMALMEEKRIEVRRILTTKNAASHPPFLLLPSPNHPPLLETHLLL